MSALLDDVETLLMAAGAVSSDGVIYHYDMPDTPNDAVALYEAGGRGPEQVHETRSAYRRPRVQVMTRATSPARARELAELAFTTLDGLANVHIGGAWYREISADSDVIGLGRDDRQRTMFSVNVNVVRSTT
jgi:hypothetical protein